MIEGERVQTLPTTKAICPACGNNKAYWWMRQLRAADESEVRFFRCTKCGKTWREYQ
ncbi:MAG: zinc ribbon domain-containing protein [Archaeoglobaceae archaeon]